MDQPLFHGALSELTVDKPSYQVALSAHLGWAIPMRNFNNQVDPDYLAELNLEYRYAPTYAVLSVLGQYNFATSYKINAATLYLRSYWPWQSNYEVYAQAGVGLFDPDNLDAVAGISIGAGINRSLIANLAAELGIDYFHLFNKGKDIDFVGTKIGLSYGF